jgi:aspartyl-tRNA(Asn)/glutamyl-tRNA(Gln) amidotransferase subunit A
LPEVNSKGGFPAAEAFAWHAPLLAARARDYDPRVRVRIERGRDMLAAGYVRLRGERRRLIASFNDRLSPYDALLMPTVAKVAPPITAFADDAEFARLNAIILRNPMAINFLDGCAATVLDPAAGLPSNRTVGGRPAGKRRAGAAGRTGGRGTAHARTLARSIDARAPTNSELDLAQPYASQSSRLVIWPSTE